MPPLSRFFLDLPAVYAIAKNPDPVRQRDLYEDVQALIHLRDWAIRGTIHIASASPIPRPPVSPQAPDAEQIVAEFWADLPAHPPIRLPRSLADLGKKPARRAGKLERLEAILKNAGHDPALVFAAEQEGMHLVTTNAPLISLCSPARQNGLSIDVMRPVAALKMIEALFQEGRTDDV